MKREIRAFTLTEVIVVVVIVGLITAMAIPNYVKAIRKADERNMIANLIAIRSAVKIYTTTGWTIGAWGSLPIISTNLGLSLIDPMSNYQCGGGTCSGTHPNGWGIRFNTPDGSLSCFNGPCPSCAANCG